MRKNVLLGFAALLCCSALLSSCGTPEQPPIDPVTSDTMTDAVETTESTEPEVPAIDRNITKYVQKKTCFSYWNGGLYFYGTSSPVTRYNIETGNVTSACYDPLCSHKSMECPIFVDRDRGMGFILVDGKMVYRRLVYEVNRKEHKIDISNQRCYYDMSTTEYRILKDEPAAMNSGMLADEIYYDQKWYYYETSYDEETGKTFGGVFCINTENGKITDYSEKTKELNIQKILFCVDDRLYFTDAGSVFSTDMNLEDLQVHVSAPFVGKFRTDGEAVFYAETEYPYGTDSMPVHRLRRYDITDWFCTDLDIVTDYSLWFLTDQYIYYAPFEAVDGDIGDFYLNFKSIWRCKHDGSEKEKVFDLLYFHEGETKPYCAISIDNLSVPVVVGDSMYAMFNKWEDMDADGKREEGEIVGSYTDDDQVLLLHVNLTDGSYEIIEVE